MDDLQHFDDVLFAYVLGCLSAAETAGIQVHLEACGRCSQMLRQVRDDTAQLALALQPLPVPALVRESLLHAIGEVSRFFDWAEPVAQIAGCTPATAQRWLDDLDEPDAWEDSRDPGVQTQQVPTPSVGLFFRLQPGTQVPHDEGTSPTLLIVQGKAFDSNAVAYHPGAVVALRPDDHAELTAAAGPDLICLSLQSAPATAGGGMRATPPLGLPVAVLPAHTAVSRS